MLEVGWPLFAFAATRIESTRNCCASARHASKSDREVWTSSWVFTAIGLFPYLRRFSNLLRPSSGFPPPAGVRSQLAGSGHFHTVIPSSVRRLNPTCFCGVAQSYHCRPPDE